MVYDRARDSTTLERTNSNGNECTVGVHECAVGVDEKIQQGSQPDEIAG
jgi:hypothetical protein